MQTFIPYKWHYVSNGLLVLYILLSQVIYIMLYVKNVMSGKFDDHDENVEICKISYLKIASDCLAYVWLVNTYNGLLIDLADQ